MTKQDNNATSKTMGRRDLLKALAAAGGAVTAASLLPGTWVKPVIEAGILPAHAQTSGLLRIDSLVVNPSTQPDPLDDVTGQAIYNANFKYEDEACQVDGDTLLTASTGLDGTIINNQALNSIGAVVSSDPCAGSISFLFNSVANFYNTTTLTVKINAGGRDSNTLTEPFPVTDAAN